MEFLSHLPTEMLIGLIILMAGALWWLLRTVYNLFKDRFTAWDNTNKENFKEIKDNFVAVDKHLTKVNRNIDMLFIEQKSSDFALDALISNGKRYSTLKETEKQRLIRDYEFQNV